MVVGVEPDPIKARLTRLHVRIGRLVYRMTLRLMAEGAPMTPGLVSPVVDIRDERGERLDLVKRPDSWPEPDSWGLRQVSQDVLLGRRFRGNSQRKATGTEAADGYQAFQTPAISVKSSRRESTSWASSSSEAMRLQE
jgi:hypothetical protein